MKGEKWTPGPWFVATGCSWRRILQERTDEPVIVPTKSRHDGHPDLMGGDANLQLAAAAPELYEALEGAVSNFDNARRWHEARGGDMYPDADWVVNARDALAKARGEEA